MSKVRNGSVGYYRPVGWDRLNPPFGVLEGKLEVGQKIKAVNRPGCPKCGVMDHCHIVDHRTGEFLGLIHVNSFLRV